MHQHDFNPAISNPSFFQIRHYAVKKYASKTALWLGTLIGVVMAVGMTVAAINDPSLCVLAKVALVFLAILTAMLIRESFLLHLVGPYTAAWVIAGNGYFLLDHIMEHGCLPRPDNTTRQGGW